MLKSVIPTIKINFTIPFSVRKIGAQIPVITGISKEENLSCNINMNVKTMKSSTSLSFRVLFLLRIDSWVMDLHNTRWEALQDLYILKLTSGNIKISDIHFRKGAKSAPIMTTGLRICAACRSHSVNALSAHAKA